MNVGRKSGFSLEKCRLCGHACGVDRLAGDKGRCKAGKEIRIQAHLLHQGEEPPISGTKGSGTIFFSRCSLTCVFCQNHQISQQGLGRDISIEDLARIMLDLQAQGAHNINLVSPTPYVPQIAAALIAAKDKGLSLPVVYNTGGFDSPAALEIIDPLVDVYLPDAKYAHKDRAEKYSGAGNYPAVNQAALKAMHQSKGGLILDRRGLAKKGVLIRHLVLPQNLPDAELVLAWLANEFGPETYVSLMAQYHPCYLAEEKPEDYPKLARPLTEGEYDRAMDKALELGLTNTFVQELNSAETYLPDFERPSVFLGGSG